MCKQNESLFLLFLCLYIQNKQIDGYFWYAIIMLSVFGTILIYLKSLRNLCAPPVCIATDSKEISFAYPTRFKSQAVSLSTLIPKYKILFKFDISIIVYWVYLFLHRIEIIYSIMIIFSNIVHKYNLKKNLVSRKDKQSVLVYVCRLLLYVCVCVNIIFNIHLCPLSSLILVWFDYWYQQVTYCMYFIHVLFDIS